MKNTKLPKVIGVGGTFASGKDTIAELLEKNHGYYHVSTGDLVREETEKMYKRTDRAILKKHANMLREDYGPGILVELAMKRYDTFSNTHPNGVVISGIRSTSEVDVIHIEKGEMIFVDAEPKIRYDRIMSRKRSGEDSLSFEEFIDSEKEELKSANSQDHKQNILGVAEKADRTIQNNGTLEEFYAEFLKPYSL